MIRPVNETEVDDSNPQLSFAPQDAQYGITRTGVSGDQYAPFLSSLGANATGATPTFRDAPLSMQGSPSAAPSTRPGARGRINRAFGACKDALAIALENEDQPLAKANALYVCRDEIGNLWNERANRETAFAIVINRLRTMFFDFEMIVVTAEKVQAIFSVVRQAAASSTLADSDIKQFNAILDKAGCDVFKGLRSQTNDTVTDEASS